MADQTAVISISKSSLGVLREAAFLVLLLAVLYSFLACAAFSAVYSLSKSGLRSLPNKLNLAAVIVMFALTTIYVIVDSLQLWAIYDVVGGNLHSFENPILSNTVGIAILQAVYGINAVLGDAIVLWRVMVIWSWRKRIVFPCLLLLILVIVAWVLATVPSLYMSVFATSVSLAVSVWGTILVSVKAWQRRQMLRKNVALMSRHNALENVFNILTESGIAYILLWTVYLIAVDIPGGTGLFKQIITNIAVVAVPLYPTMVVILVAKNKTPICNQLTEIEPITQVESEGRDLLGQDSEMGKTETVLDIQSEY
ncbi:unnamed protein product [Peniophora sp. CBMAI 1063]|nr:unnamed protein product [Peniophora sp. CBMAI 1063]